ncbi:MAG: extracellular solute-binding protein [Eubacteriales bacterium]|nr:extracellular solute-binding protein [Eubacteriales bacterium]
MKKILAMLLAAAMVLGLVACSQPAAETQAPATEAATTAAPAATEAAKEEAPATITEVDYYCSIGAYLSVLQEEVDKWNKGEGAQKGVYINIISNINSYISDLDALMQAGTHYDLIDAGTTKADWVEAGWIQDLEAIDDAALKATIEGYKEYLGKGINYQGSQNILVALPLEVLPLKMAVNTDLFEKNGLELPKTWDDIVECAKVITENGNGVEFGYGWSTWGSCFSRLTELTSMNSTGKAWWDPNTETYDWSQFEKQMECVKTMYQNGWMIGADDLAIDPIRAKFAEGVVGMFPAPAYDYAVYTTQFPAQCNWTVIDMPTVEAGEAPFKGVWLDRVGCSIDAVNYADADDVKKQAMVDAFVFLNSDELNQVIFENGGMIPYKASVIANATPKADLGPQWAIFGQIENYTSVPRYPDSLLPLEGEKADVCWREFMQNPNQTFAETNADLVARYNAAYQELKKDGDIDLSNYVYAYSNAK